MEKKEGIIFMPFKTTSKLIDQQFTKYFLKVTESELTLIKASVKDYLFCNLSKLMCKDILTDKEMNTTMELTTKLFIGEIGPQKYNALLLNLLEEFGVIPMYATMVINELKNSFSNFLKKIDNNKTFQSLQEIYKNQRNDEFELILGSVENVITRFVSNVDENKELLQKINNGDRFLSEDNVKAIKRLFATTIAKECGNLYCTIEDKIFFFTTIAKYMLGYIGKKNYKDAIRTLQDQYYLSSFLKDNNSPSLRHIAKDMIKTFLKLEYHALISRIIKTNDEEMTSLNKISDHDKIFKLQSI